MSDPEPATVSTLFYEDSLTEIHRVVVGPVDNNVYVLRCRQTGDAVLFDAASDPDGLSAAMSVMMELTYARITERLRTMSRPPEAPRTPGSPKD